MPARKGISKKTRFEVFKRDSFTCQYCGRAAPDIVLEIDHINPVSAGGENDIMNLVTSCFDCNRGKGPRKITSKSEIKKQQKMLSELNERRIQLEMMLEWRGELKHYNETVLDVACEAISDQIDGAEVTAEGRKTIKNLLRKYKLEDLLDAIQISADRYIEHYGDQIRDSSIPIFFNKIGGILYNQNQPEWKRITTLVCSILKSRGLYNDKKRVAELFSKYKEISDDFEPIIALAKTSRNWTVFMEDFRAELER